MFDTGSINACSRPNSCADSHIKIVCGRVACGPAARTFLDLPNTFSFFHAALTLLQGFFGTSVLRTLASGDFFGLEELVAGEKLKCNLTSRQSSSECVLWVLDKELFLDFIKDMLARRCAFVPVAEAFLHTVPLVRDLPEEQIGAVAKACKVERFAEGQTVFKMGFHADMLCFIYKGEAIIQKPQDDGGLLEFARQGKGEYFGEMVLTRNVGRTASVVAGTELLLLCLEKDSFEALLSPLQDKMVDYHSAPSCVDYLRCVVGFLNLVSGVA